MFFFMLIGFFFLIFIFLGVHMEVTKERSRKTARAYCPLHSKYVGSKNNNNILYQKCEQLYLITPHLMSILKRDHEVHGGRGGEEGGEGEGRGRKIPESVLGAVFTYWFQKKEHNHFLPLLQRLQTLVESEKLLVEGRGGGRGGRNRGGGGGEEEGERFLSLVNLRRELDRGRLLIDLMRKRERLKRDYVINLQNIFEEECRLIEGEKEGDPYLPSIDGYYPSSLSSPSPSPSSLPSPSPSPSPLSSFFSPAPPTPPTPHIPCWPLPSPPGPPAPKWWEVGFHEALSPSLPPSSTPRSRKKGVVGRERKMPMVKTRVRKRKDKRGEKRKGRGGEEGKGKCGGENDAHNSFLCACKGEHEEGSSNASTPVLLNQGGRIGKLGGEGGKGKGKGKGKGGKGVLSPLAKEG